MDTTKQAKPSENKATGKKVVFKFDSNEDSCAKEVESSSDDSDACPLKSTFEKGSASKINEDVTEHMLEGAIYSGKTTIGNDNLHRDLDSMQVVHKNDLFEDQFNDNAEVIVDIGDDYGTRDVSLRKEPPLALDHNIVSSTEMAGLKDDQRTELLSDSRHSVSDQDSVDTRDLSPSKVFNESVWQEVSHKKKKKNEVVVSRPITRASKQSSQ